MTFSPNSARVEWALCIAAQDLTLGREVNAEISSRRHGGRFSSPQAPFQRSSSRLAPEPSKHRNVYEVSESESSPFIAMELVTGATLKQILFNGALETQQFPVIARQIG